MLTRITDLFVGGATRYSEDQIGVFDDVMVRLTSTIEAKARARLANRLAPIANAPASVVHMLAFDDDIDVARPILRQSERLDDSVLLANANTKSQQHLFAISQRRQFERSGYGGAGRTGRSRCRPFGGEERWCPVFRRRLPHVGQALRRR